MLVNGAVLDGYSPFDCVTATGLLHHLEDEEVIELFKLVKKVFGSKGKLVTIDPCFIEGQSMFSKILVKMDRGQNVRFVGEYKVLAQSVFDNVSVFHRNNMLRIPYDHAILVCS